ncbi:hypothetical protein A2U01_0116681, partial [Trifolium medium]|nr:hypothetical protein [Trifolium medium]
FTSMLKEKLQQEEGDQCEIEHAPSI